MVDYDVDEFLSFLFFFVLDSSVLDDVPDLHVTGGTIHNETITGNLNANAKLLAELTPPVTPDSAPMSIGNSPNFKQQPTFLTTNANISRSIIPKKVCICVWHFEIHL